MKKKILLISLVFLLLVIFIPIGIDYLIIGNDFYSNIPNSDWVQFLGSYTGSLIGSVGGFIGIVMTINYSKDQAYKEREFLLARDREERRLSIAPLFLVYKDRESKEKSNSDFIISLDGKKSNTSINTVLVITNLGLGGAVDFELKFVSYRGNDLGHSYSGAFVKVDSPDRVVIDFRIYLPELPDEKEYLEKYPEESLDQYSIPMKYRYDGSTPVNLELTYKDLMGNKYCQELTISFQINFRSGSETGNQWAYSSPGSSVNTKKAYYVDEESVTK